jgi:hypothetical protein
VIGRYLPRYIDTFGKIFTLAVRRVPGWQDGPDEGWRSGRPPEPFFSIGSHVPVQLAVTVSDGHVWTTRCVFRSVVRSEAGVLVNNRPVWND